MCLLIHVEIFLFLLFKIQNKFLLQCNFMHCDINYSGSIMTGSGSCVHTLFRQNLPMDHLPPFTKAGFWYTSVICELVCRLSWVLVLLFLLEVLTQNFWNRAVLHLKLWFPKTSCKISINPLVFHINWVVEEEKPLVWERTAPQFLKFYEKLKF